MRYADLGKPEVLCRYCGAVAPPGRIFCDVECYRQKRLGEPIEQRFWSKVNRSGDCWLWTASRWSSGYGQFSLPAGRNKRKTIGAHVFAYELANGPVPDGLEIMHRCDTPLCVRPDHLMVGTHLLNVQDAAAKGKYRVSRPSKQKLSATQVQDIRSLVASGEKQIRVAERFGVSEGYISRIMRGTLRQYDAPLPRPIEKAS